MKPHEYTVSSLAETAEVGRSIANQLRFPACVYLEGVMGVGKTTLTKSILSGLGYQGAVTSPTYNLVQEYEVEQGRVYHMDLYRVQDPSELEFLALEDLWGDNVLFLVEWPRNGAGWLRPADFQIDLSIFYHHEQKKRKIILKS